MEQLTITYGDHDISFQLHRKKVKNINLNLKPDMTIVVSANDNVPVDVIKSFVKGKASWILKNIKYFKDTQPEVRSQKEYVSGESFKYLGKQLRLKVEESEEAAVKYLRGYLHLQVADKTDYNKKERLMDKWFREKAEVTFHESLDNVYRLVEKYGIKKPEIIIRTMKARWGSCIKDKHIILLNFELIKAPKYCIDYVVLHELSHFIHKNHDAKFYNFLSVLMPDWKERKKILDEEVVRSL